MGKHEFISLLHFPEAAKMSSNNSIRNKKFKRRKLNEKRGLAFLPRFSDFCVLRFVNSIFDLFLFLSIFICGQFNLSLISALTLTLTKRSCHTVSSTWRSARCYHTTARWLVLPYYQCYHRYILTVLEKAKSGQFMSNVYKFWLVERSGASDQEGNINEHSKVGPVALTYWGLYLATKILHRGDMECWDFFEN